MNGDEPLDEPLDEPVFRYNWAVIFQKGKPFWSYPEKIPENKLDGIIRLSKALTNLGGDIFGSESQIGMIRIEAPYYLLPSIPILVARLSENYEFFISNPEVTAYLLELYKLPQDLEFQLKGFLVGAAILTYSHYYESALLASRQKTIDQIFQRALLMIREFTEEEAVVGNGICQLNGLSLAELILFHYYIKLGMLEEYKPLSPSEWFICNHIHGVPIYAKFNLKLYEETILSALLASFSMFAEEVFGGKPTQITFGETRIKNLYMICGNQTVCGFTHPDIFFTTEMQRILPQLPSDVRQDINDKLKEFLISRLQERLQYKLRNATVNDILKQEKVVTLEKSWSLDSFTLDIAAKYEELLKFLTSNDLEIKHTIEKKTSKRLNVLFVGTEEDLTTLYKILSSDGTPLELPPFRFAQIPDIEFQVLPFNTTVQSLKISMLFLFSSNDFKHTHFKSEVADSVHLLCSIFNFNDLKTFNPSIQWIETFWNRSSQFKPAVLLGILPSAYQEHQVEKSEQKGELNPIQHVLYHISMFKHEIPQTHKKKFIFLPFDPTIKEFKDLLIKSLIIQFFF